MKAGNGSFEKKEGCEILFIHFEMNTNWAPITKLLSKQTSLFKPQDHELNVLLTSFLSLHIRNETL
jgi:hypothetical protein